MQYPHPYLDLYNASGASDSLFSVAGRGEVPERPLRGLDGGHGGGAVRLQPWPSSRCTRPCR
jgi:hypothetical protein